MRHLIPAIGPLASFVVALVACGDGPDRPQPPASTETWRDFPDGGATLGRGQQAIYADGFMGWRAGQEGLKRGSRCTFGPDATQTCFVPAAKVVRYYVDPAGFSAADLTVIQNQLAFHRTYWVDLLGIEDLGWTFEQGTATDHNARLIAGSVNGALFPAGDSRHWSQVGCDASATQTEPVALDGVWKRCGAITVTLDVAKLLDDGAAANTRTPRIKQTASQLLQWAAGLGLGNIYPGTTFQIAASTSSGLVPSFDNRQLCALHSYHLGLKTEIRKAPLNDCDGWEWPE